jgi:ligand-binding sensor domain-containing protein
MDQGGAAIFESRLAGWELVAHVPAAGLAGPKVRSVFQDSRGRVWLGSENDGVAVRLGDQTLRVLTVDHGLSAQEILVIREGPEGDMWLGTIDGLTRIGPAALSVLFSS